MEVPNEVEVVIKNVSSKGIIIRNREEITDKGEEIKTTEYFLDVGDQGDGDEVDETQFVTVQSDQDGQYVAVEVADSGQLLIPDKEVILWNEICRVCANSGSDKEFIPIFSGEGAEHNLSSKIHAYLPMRVSENDTLPLQVCYNCAATMIAWDEIFKGCMDAQQRLLELQSKLNEKEQYYNDSPDAEENMGTVLEVETTNHEESQVETKESLETLQIIQPNRSRSSQTPKIDSSYRLKDPFNQKKSLKSSDSNGSECLTVMTVTQNLETVISKEPVKKADFLVSEKVDAVEKESRSSSRITTKVLDTLDMSTLTETSDPRKSTEFSEKEIATAAANGADLPELEESENIEDGMEVAGFSGSPDESADRSSESSDVDAPEKASSEIDEKPKSKKRMPVSYTCDDCGKIFKFRDTFSRHRRIHSDERPFTCHVCGKQFRDSGGLCRHVRDVHAKVKKWPCSSCTRSFASKATRDDHERTHTGERPYICDSCGKSFKTKASLYIHAKIHTNLFPHSCVHCDKSFRRRQELLSHVTTHTGEKNFECDVCFKSFRIKMELRRHALSHSDDKPFVCDLCDFKCKQRRYLNNHVKHKHSLIVNTPNEGANTCLNLEDGGVITILTTEPTTISATEIDAATFVMPRRRKRSSKWDPLEADGSKKSRSVNRTVQRRQEIVRAKVIVDGTTYYKCEECPKLLSTPYNYVAHKRVHTHERPCTCEICGKSFTAGSSLNRHVRDVHQKIKDYKCDYCERRLASKVARDEHQRTHTDERPHVCETCGKSFRQRASLSVHRRFHSKSFLFNCKLCHRGFPRKQDMERHELTHTDQKPYGCKLCDKTFRSSASAIRHRSTHDNDNKHICDVCGECFNQERYLKNHKKKVHKDD